jgi:hypothetical protein
MGLVSKGGRATGAVAALLLLLHLLGAALATVPGKPTVMDIRAGLGARLLASASQVGAQDGYNEYGVEEQEVRLATDIFYPRIDNVISRTFLQVPGGLRKSCSWVAKNQQAKCSHADAVGYS